MSYFVPVVEWRDPRQKKKGARGLNGGLTPLDRETPREEG